jgi:hypothetical protein
MNLLFLGRAGASGFLQLGRARRAFNGRHDRQFDKTVLSLLNTLSRTQP